MFNSTQYTLDTQGYINLDVVTCMYPLSLKSAPSAFAMTVDLLDPVYVNILRVTAAQITDPAGQLLVLGDHGQSEISVNVNFESAIPIHEEFSLQLYLNQTLRFNVSQKVCSNKLVDTQFHFKCQYTYSIENYLIENITSIQVILAT